MMWKIGVGEGEGVNVGVEGIGVKKLSGDSVDVATISMTVGVGVDVCELVVSGGGVNTPSQAVHNKIRRQSILILLPQVNRLTRDFTKIIIPHYSVKYHKKYPAYTSAFLDLLSSKSMWIQVVT